MNKRPWLISGALILILAAAGVVVIAVKPGSSPAQPVFNGEQAYADVNYQVTLGPRVPGSLAHAQAVQWMVDQLKGAGWQVEIQDTQAMGHPIRNVIAKKGSGTPWRILGAHYDSRMYADRDPNLANRTKPVPAADDGASGVADLLELARDLKDVSLNGQVWLVFFDAEDQGDINGWDWILGSEAFVKLLDGRPDAVVVIDMIGDRNLNIYKEVNSNPTLTDTIWQIAASLGYQEQFIPQAKYPMIDDHTPFLQAGLTAIDIIDFDYPYYHTLSDTPDKVSAASLKAVGDTLLKWITTP